MFKILTALTLTTLFANLGCPASAVAQDYGTTAQTNAPQALNKEDVKRARKAKKIVSGLGFGRSARVAIRLHDKTELKGYVGETGDDYFILTDEQSTRVSYAQVDKAKPWPTAKPATKGASLASRIFTKIAIGAAIFGGIVVVCVVSHRCED